MEIDPQSTNLQILLEAIETDRQTERFTLYLSGYLLQYIQVRTPNEVNVIYNLLSTLNNGVKDSLITLPQRRSLLQHLLKVKYSSVELFEKSLNKQFQTLVNRNLMGENNQPTNNQEQLSEQLISQLLENEQKEKEKREKAQQQSLLLMKELQLRDQQSYNNKVNEASKVEIKMDCPICLEQIKLADLALLSCQHPFHKECMFRHFVQNIDERKFPLKCPGCQKDCIESDVTEYLDREYMAKYEKLTFENYVNIHHEDMSWCPTAGCQYVFSFDEGESEFSCPLCHKVYCLKCKVLFHTGVTCKEFNINRVFDKNDQKFIEFVRGAKYKQCPSCKFWVEKNEGCDHMTCRCKYEFCYVCGGKYQACACNEQVRAVRPIPIPFQRPRPPVHGRPRPRERYMD